MSRCQRKPLRSETADNPTRQKRCQRIGDSRRKDCAVGRAARVRQGAVALLRHSASIRPTEGAEHGPCPTPPQSTVPTLGGPVPGARRPRALEELRPQDRRRALRVTTEADQIRGEWTDPRLGRITFGEWSERVEAGRVNAAPSTRASYDVVLRGAVLPTFGDVPLAAIEPGNVRRWWPSWWPKATTRPPPSAGPTPCSRKPSIWL